MFGDLGLSALLVMKQVFISGTHLSVLLYLTLLYLADLQGEDTSDYHLVSVNSRSLQTKSPHLNYFLNK